MRNEFFSNDSKDFEILFNTNAIFRKKTARIFKVFIKILISLILTNYIQKCIANFLFRSRLTTETEVAQDYTMNER